MAVNPSWAMYLRFEACPRPGQACPEHHSLTLQGQVGSLQPPNFGPKVHTDVNSSRKPSTHNAECMQLRVQVRNLPYNRKSAAHVSIKQTCTSPITQHI